MKCVFVGKGTMDDSLFIFEQGGAYESGKDRYKGCDIQ